MKNTVATIAAVSLAGGLATFAEAQTQQGQGQQNQNTEAQQQTQNQQGQMPAQAGAQQQGDPVVATVGNEEIRRSNVTEAITSLPPQVQQAPPEMLFPAVVDQLITRRLIVEQARAENLQDDPEVQALVTSDAEAVEEQALIEVWLRRQIEERVTDAEVQKTVEELTAANPDAQQTPGLIPQVRQALQVQAMADISEELRQNAEVTLYGPDGEPVPAGGAQTQVGQGADQQMDQGAGQQMNETQQ